MFHWEPSIIIPFLCYHFSGIQKSSFISLNFIYSCVQSPRKQSDGDDEEEVPVQHFMPEWELEPSQYMDATGTIAYANSSFLSYSPYCNEWLNEPNVYASLTFTLFLYFISLVVLWHELAGYLEAPSLDLISQCFGFRIAHHELVSFHLLEFTSCLGNFRMPFGLN